VSREVRFSFDTEAQKQGFEEYAKARGLSLSAFAKHACFVVRDKYKLGSHHPAKGRGRHGAPRVVGDLGGQL
jgi:hypothetical protein